MLFEGGLTGPSPVDRARIGSKHHLLVDAAGLPLAVALTGGNRNDVTQLLPLLDGIAPVPGKVGRPRQRPDRIVADRATTTITTGVSYGAAASSRPSPVGEPSTARG